MQRTIVFILGLSIALATLGIEVAHASDEPSSTSAKSAEAMEIMKKAEQAAKKIKLARYTAEYKATGWVTKHVPHVEGTAVIGEPSEYDLLRFFAEIKLTPYDTKETTQVSAGCDGDLSYLIDHQAKMVYADIDPAVLGAHERDIQRLLVREFVAEEPFADELKAKKMELQDEVQVGDEKCHQVRVELQPGRAAIWSFSKKDLLPRRIERVYANREDPEAEPGTTTLTLTNLVAETKFRIEPFKLAVPPGFTKTDEFAP
ncbi:MAG: hypothetical protein KJ749_10760 [Planctomycetes bacterium]|nr:hypothetical protein [Planctomycetota bacterium]